MRSFEILDIKHFMAKLLLSPAFDFFLLKEASITTFCTFSIDGKLHRDYFSYTEEERETYADLNYPYWERVRPFCFSLIKGKKTPSQLKLVFLLTPKRTEQFLASHSLPYQRSDVSGLYLNVLYDGKKLSCTSGTALTIFTLDKTLEHLWDETLPVFLKKHQLPFA